MSFKREGDDRNSLDILRKRRVTDLLAFNIPEDEALLTRSGKYACMVCPWRPVFDTLAMLSTHRDGKKHKHHNEVMVENKRQLEELKTKRRQLTGSEEGDADLVDCSIPSKASNALLSAAPYVARVQRHKRKPHERRPIVNLNSSSALSETEREIIVSQMDNIETPAQYRQLVSAVRQQSSMTCQPYRGRSRDSGEEASLASSNFSPGAATSLSTNASQPFSHVGNIHHNYKASNSLRQRLPAPASTGANNCASPAVYSQTPTQLSVRAAYLSAATKTVDANIRPAASESAQQYLHARGSGWIRSADGSWHKEEGVEFDSDDEPPELP